MELHEAGVRGIKQLPLTASGHLESPDPAWLGVERLNEALNQKGFNSSWRPHVAEETVVRRDSPEPDALSLLSHAPCHHVVTRCRRGSSHIEPLDYGRENPNEMWAELNHLRLEKRPEIVLIGERR